MISNNLKRSSKRHLFSRLLRRNKNKVSTVSKEPAVQERVPVTCFVSQSQGQDGRECECSDELPYVSDIGMGRIVGQDEESTPQEEPDPRPETHVLSVEAVSLVVCQGTPGKEEIEKEYDSVPHPLLDKEYSMCIRKEVGIDLDQAFLLVKVSQRSNVFVALAPLLRSSGLSTQKKIIHIPVSGANAFDAEIGFDWKRYGMSAGQVLSTRVTSVAANSSVEMFQTAVDGIIFVTVVVLWITSNMTGNLLAFLNHIYVACILYMIWSRTQANKRQSRSRRDRAPLLASVDTFATKDHAIALTVSCTLTTSYASTPENDRKHMQRICANERADVHQMCYKTSAEIKALEELYTEDSMVQADLFERYVVACSGNREMALCRLQDTVSYRKQHNINGILKTPHPKFSLIKTFYHHSFLGTAKNGDCILYDQMGRFHESMLSLRNSAVTSEDLMAHAHLIMEYFCVHVDPRPYPHGRFIRIYDFEGFKVAHARDIESIKLGTRIINMIDRHYPERLALAVVINAPPILSMFWNMVKPMLQARTVAKFRVCRGKKYSKQVLRELVDEEVLHNIFEGQEDESVVQTPCSSTERNFIAFVKNLNIA